MIAISDHALVRFLDRVAGLDVEGLRLTLSRALGRAQALADTLGEQDYTIKIDGAVYVVKGGVLVTIMDRASERRQVP